jgi:serine/threonine protein kinase/tetratricopeptide (TPR) repeat protein
MTPERWKQVEEIFSSALEREAGERAAFLASACGGDESLRVEVEKLLRSHDKAGSFIEDPPFKVPPPIKVKRSTEALAGRSIGHYKVLGLLGSGGMGDVYLAEDSRLHRKVALKMLPLVFTEDAARLRRFEQEARAISALNHPNIVTIYEVGETDAGRFIAIEYIEGETLRAIKDNGRLSPEALLQVCGQMAKALRAAHQAGIVHRDLKPENIMVRNDGYVKVLDFGLARLVPRKDIGSGIEEETKLYDSVAEAVAGQTIETGTVPGMIIGTMRYMSPEQARGKPTDRATDIFSLGIVFYELATGYHPFMADSPIAVMNAILSQQPLAPARFSPQINPAFESLILRMLEKDPVLRPTAGEVDAALSELDGKSLSVRMDEPRPTAAPRRHTVGHEEERAELRACFEAATTRSGLLVCVTGEPGIGKTTLVEDFINEPQAGGRSRSSGSNNSSSRVSIVARGRCSERLAGTEAYLPFLEVLDSLLRGEAGEQAARIMRHVAPSWYIHVAPASDNDSSDARLRSDIKTTSQERMKRELYSLLHDLSQIKPLIIFIDDLHWADVSTVDLLAYLAGKFETLRVLIVTTYRSPDLMLAKHPFLQLKRDLQARGDCRQIMLQFLTREDVERYLRLEFPSHTFPAELPALIHSKTEGSPLFMVDMVRYLRDRNVIAEDDGVWHLAQSLPDMERELPQSIRSMIQRKIDQLGGEDFRLLVAASAQGYEFDSAVVSEALGIDPAEVEERLEDLDRVHYFVRLIGEKEFPDRTLTLRYRFVHVLYQNALYASLKPTRRVSFSRAVAESLRSHYGEQESAVAARLAVLFETARDFQQAARYFLLAAQQAAQVFANQEVVQLARRGIDLLKLLPDTPDRSQQELMFHVTMGVPLLATRGFASPEVEENYTHARSLCDQLGLKSELFPVLAGLWLLYVSRGELVTAREIAEQLVEVASTCDDAVLQVEAYAMLGVSLTHTGKFAEALEQVEKGIALYEVRKHFAYTGHDPGMMCLSFSGWNLWSMGYPDRALKRVKEAVALAEKLSHPQSMALSHFIASLIHYLRREAQDSLMRVEKSLAISLEHGLPQTIAWCSCMRGHAVATLGRPKEGIAIARGSLAAQKAMGARIGRPNFLSVLSEILSLDGQVEEALAGLDEGLSLIQKNGEHTKEAKILWLKGKFLLQRAGLNLDTSVSVADEAAPDIDPQIISEAEACFHQSIEVARRQQAKSWELRAVTSLCRLRQKTGTGKEEARAMLADVYGWFTEGFDILDLKEAKALLDQMSPAEALH